MKLSRGTTSGPSLTDEFANPTRAGSATTSAAAEALAAAAAAAETDYAPSAGGGGQSRFLDARREKNRLAAKRCRDRKQAHLVALEAELAKQQKANDALSRHVVTLVGLYQQERKHKLAANAILTALAATLHVPSPSPSSPASSTTGELSAAPAPAPMPLSLLPLLGGGSKSLSEVLTELDAGLMRGDDLEVYVRELRSLRLQVLPVAAAAEGGGGGRGAGRGRDADGAAGPAANF